MNAEFSKQAAAVLASPYFSLSRYDGDKEDRDAVVDYSESKWAEKQALFQAVKDVDSAADLNPNARAIWDRAYDAMMAVGHVKQQENEDDDAYDVRARMEEPLTGWGPAEDFDDEDEEEYDPDADLAEV